MKAMADARNKYPKVQEYIVSPEQYRALKQGFAENARYNAVPLNDPALTFLGTPIRVEEPKQEMRGLASLLSDNYKTKLAANIFQSSPLLDYLKKENEVSIVKDIRAGINLGKETKRVKTALKKFEGSWLYKLKAGAHIGFTVTFDGNATKYSYAGLFDGKRWHLTGARSPQGISTDDLVDWLIEHNVSFGSVKLYKVAR
jgi:hypothetical protein